MSVRAHRKPAPARPVETPLGLRSQGRGTIRGRLLRILALPLVVVIVLLAVVVNRDLGEYNSARETTGAVRLVLAVQNLVEDLQTERGLTAGFLGGDVGFQKEMVASRVTVDSQRSLLAGLLSASVTQQAAGRAVLSKLDNTISETRQGIDGKKIDRTAAFDYFTVHIDELNAINFGLDSSTDRDLRRGVGALTALGVLKEQYAKERALLNGVFSAGGYATGEYGRYALIVATKTQALATFDQDATAGQKWLKDYALDSGAAREAMFFEDRAIKDPSTTFKEQTNPQSWWSAFTTVLADLRIAQEAVGKDITAIAGGLQTDATRRLSILAGLVLLGLFGAGLVLILSARSITRPLKALVREAEGLAQQRLPEAVSRAMAGQDDAVAAPSPVTVPISSSSEIVSVAAALDRVQSTAYLLATEQATLRRSTAESLANLGRRNQNLLRRQLSFITRLEQEESDPQGLANLFELDHLATRMRRNAESLLVLVGEATPRRWAAPLPIADVIRAAISEVEEYRRVSLKRIDDGWVGGAYVAGIAHMIAELVENGLSFSPPDLDVEIQGRNLGTRYLIAVTDQGVGMDPAEMDRANARLRGEENYLSVPTRFLGHYVVGHLGAQMGVEVEISPSPVTGITARVTLPSPVLAQPPALAPGGAGLAAATAQAQARAATATRSRMAAPQVATAQFVGEAQDSSWTPTPTRALGSRPVVEYVPMATAHERDPLGFATSALPFVEATGYVEQPAPARPAASQSTGGNGYQNGGHPGNGQQAMHTGEYAYPVAEAYQPAPAYPAAETYQPTSAYPTGGETYQPREYPARESYRGGGAERPAAQRADTGPTSGYPTTPGYPTPAGYAPPPSYGGNGSGQPDGYPAAPVDRTTNGLVKRVPRSRAGAPPPSAPEPAERYAPMDSSPASVRSRLTSLRDGMARGEGERGANRSHPDQHR